MNPHDVQKHLAPYADGELAVDVRREVEGHLAHDPDARAEVDRWRALRRCAQRGLVSQSLPSGLRERLRHRLDAERGARRVYMLRRVFSTITAAAALILMSVMIWGSGRLGAVVDTPPGPLVSADSLAEIYRKCGVAHHHDPLGLKGKSRAEAERVLARIPEVSFAAHLPDLSASGFELHGVCKCSPAKGIEAVHAFYARGDAAAREHAGPRDVLSFFAIASPVRLGCACPVCDRRGCLHHPQRNYSVAIGAGRETVVKWDEQSRSYAVCSVLEREELLPIIDPIRVAARGPLPQSTVAAVPPPTRPVTAIALVALAVVVLPVVGYSRAR